jgi:hypothetical protein
MPFLRRITRSDLHLHHAPGAAEYGAVPGYRDTPVAATDSSAVTQ